MLQHYQTLPRRGKTNSVDLRRGSKNIGAGDSDSSHYQQILIRLWSLICILSIDYFKHIFFYQKETWYVNMLYIVMNRWLINKVTPVIMCTRDAGCSVILSVVIKFSIHVHVA